MRVLISGYYGCGNAGDEAVLDGLLNAFKRAGDVEPTVLSARPEWTRGVHNVPAVSRMHIGDVWRELQRTDLFVSGGGGLLQDRTSRRSPLYYLSAIACASRAGVPVYLHGQGVGPLQSHTVRAAARMSLPRIIGAGVRDHASRDLLVELGVPSARVEVTADAAFALDSPTVHDQVGAFERAGLPLGHNPLLGVVWRSPDVRGAEDEAALRRVLARSLVDAARSMEAEVVVIGLHRDRDRDGSHELAQEVARSADDVPVHVPDVDLIHSEWVAVLSALDMVLSIRYHGLLLAALGNVPGVALAYDPKVEHLAAELDAECLPVTCREADLTEALLTTWSERTLVRKELRSRVATLRLRALAEGARALRLYASHTRRPSRDPAGAGEGS